MSHSRGGASPEGQAGVAAAGPERRRVPAMQDATAAGLGAAGLHAGAEPASGRPDGPSLRDRAVRGGLWTAGGFGLGVLIRLGSNVLLAQLLLAEDFGLMGLVAIALIGLEMFSDLGIGPALVQSERTDRRFRDTAWTLQAARGFALWGAAAAAAWPLSVALDAPELAQVLPVAGASAAFSGLQSTNWFSVMRELSLRGRVLIELSTAGVVAGVMVGWAYGFDASVWALVAGTLAAAGFRTALSHTLPGGWNRPCLDPVAARQLLGFGGWLFLSTVLTFLALNLDKLLLKAFTGLTTFGVFYVGYSLALLGTQLAERVGSQVGFPALSAVHRERPAGFPRAFTRARLAVMAPIGACMLGLVALGPSLFHGLYPVRFWPAGWVVQVLGFSVLGSLVSLTYGWAAVARGDTALKFRLVAAQLGAGLPCVLGGWALGGDTGFVLGLGVAHLARYPLDAWLLRRCGLWQPRVDLAFFTLGTLGTLAAVAAAGVLTPAAAALGAAP